MHPLLQRSQYFIKEHVGVFKAANNFDIHDPETGEVLLHCREPNLGFFTKLLRFTDYKRMTPFEVVIGTPQGQALITVKRGISLFLSRVEVLDEQQRTIGSFKQKLFSIGGKFDVLDDRDEVICTLQGQWTSWDFRFMKGQEELAQVNKQWAGLAKELLTSADHYALRINPALAPDDHARQMILAAVMCIDMVLKE